MGVVSSPLSGDECLRLKDPFFLEGIKDAIWLSGGDKIPGSNGFNMGFFKKCWNTIKEDIVSLLNEFYVNSKLPKAIIVSILTLIPKMESPQEVSDFCTIYLVNSLYRIVAKMLATKLKNVMPSLISRNQSIFFFFKIDKCLMVF